MRTTFSSPFGHSRFRKLRFGLNLSPDLFQERMDQILEHNTGTVSIAYDVGVFGLAPDNPTPTANNHELIFKCDDCRIKTNKLDLHGLEFYENDVHPDPTRIDDIRSMRNPADYDVLCEYTDIATYMSPCIQKRPNHASHVKAFESTTKLLYREVTLAYFKQGADIVIRARRCLCLRSGNCFDASG